VRSNRTDSLDEFLAFHQPVKSLPRAMGSIVMPQWKLVAVDHPQVPPLLISDRLRSQLVYFMTPPDTPGVPPLGDDEYWIARGDVTRWLMEGLFLLVSPLDTQNMTEVELSEEQEKLLNWLDRYKVEHVHVVE
jgi:hypothetical protein